MIIRNFIFIGGAISSIIASSSNCGDAPLTKYENSNARFFLSRTVFYGGELLNDLDLQTLESANGDTLFRCTFQTGQEEPMSVQISLRKNTAQLSFTKKTNSILSTNRKLIKSEDPEFLGIKKLQEIIINDQFWKPLTEDEENYFLSNHAGSTFLFEKSTEQKKEFIVIVNPGASFHKEVTDIVRDCMPYHEIAIILSGVFDTKYAEDPNEKIKFVDPFK